MHPLRSTLSPSRASSARKFNSLLRTVTSNGRAPSRAKSGQAQAVIHVLLGCSTTSSQPNTARRRRDPIRHPRYVHASFISRSSIYNNILGHSERRTLFHETSEQVGKKTKAALDVSLHVILCVGETLAEREAGKTTEVVNAQLQAVVDVLHGTAYWRCVFPDVFPTQLEPKFYIVVPSWLRTSQCGRSAPGGLPLRHRRKMLMPRSVGF